MTDSGEVFVVSIPAAIADKVAPFVPSGFASTSSHPSAIDFRFGISDFHEYVGTAKDVVTFLTALVGLLGAVRAAGGNSIAVRRADETEPVQIAIEDDAAAIRAKLERKRSP
jgi:hypothetical protein